MANSADSDQTGPLEDFNSVINNSLGVRNFRIFMGASNIVLFRVTDYVVLMLLFCT